MNRVSVVHIISGDLWAGPENQLVTLLGALKSDQRFSLRVIALNHGVLVERLRALCVPVEVIAEGEHSFFKLLGAVASKLKEYDAMIVHSHRYKENILSALVARRSGATTLVQTVHGVTEVFSGVKALKARLYLLLNRLATRRAFQRVIAVSDEIREIVQQELGEKPRVVTIRNAVALETLRPSIPAAELRDRLGLQSNAPVIGMIGRLVPVKAVDLMLDAFVRIQAALPQSQLVLAGDGSAADDLRAKAARLGVAGSVHFLGNRKDVPDLLQLFDLFVISSLHEGIPTVLLEALAMERAVVATAVGGIPEVVCDGEQGLLVPPCDDQALADACVRLLQSPEQRARLAAAGRLRIEAEFSAVVLGRKVGELYAELLSQPQKDR